MAYQRLLYLTERVAFVLCSAYCLLLFLSTPSLSASDPEPGMVQGGGWAATYGGFHNDTVCSVQQTSDGGYIVAGETESFGAGEDDIWVLKLRPDGTVEWQKTYGGVDRDVARSIRQTSDGGCIVAGETESFGAGKEDIWVLKLRHDGAIDWQKTYGGNAYDWAYAVQQTHDGGYIVVGDTSSFGVGGGNVWVLKLRPDGTVEWQKTYGEVKTTYMANFIQQTSDNGYIVAGLAKSFGPEIPPDLWVLKLRPDGAVEWQKTYGGNDYDGAYSIRQTGDEGYIVAGVTGSFGAGEDDIWVLKLRSDGAVEWQKTYGGGGWDRALCIQETTDGGYIVNGQTTSFAIGWDDVWLLKLGPDGTVEWQKAYGGYDYDMTYSFQQTGDGGYIMAGYTCSGTEGWKPPDAWVLKLKPGGSIHPSCDFIRDTNIVGKDSNATVKTTSVSPKDSSAIPQDSLAAILDTNVSAKILCP